MALLLKRARFGENTIRGRMDAFITSTFVLSFLSLVFFAGIHSIFVTSCRRDLSYVLSLNELFGCVDTSKRILDDYKKTEAGDLAAFGEEVFRAQEIARGLRERDIDVVFSRDMEDIYDQLGHYRELGEQMCLSEPDRDGDILALSEASDRLYEILASQHKDFFLTLIGWAGRSQEKLGRFMKGAYVFMILLAASIMGAGLFHARRMAAQIAWPLQKLTEAAEVVRDGKIDGYQDICVEEGSYEEISRLVSVFNLMISRLRSHIHVVEENARTQKALHEQELENMRMKGLLEASQLKALQNQINPHFLFNTLNMISRTAQDEMADQTVDLLQKTARLLRYNLDHSGRTVPLSKEMEVLGDYVCLQEKRFGSRIAFDFDLDERFHDILVPSFILQPLVENAITHGVGALKEHAMISICTFLDESRETGMIVIEDNGPGMSREELLRVKAQMEEKKEQREKIGLANVNMRLHLLYQDRVDMDLESAPGQGTRVKIVFCGIREGNRRQGEGA